MEAFCNRILAGAKLDLTDQDRTDLLAYLVELCWELSTRYKPGKLAFSTWAQTTLQYRTIDWNRQWNGRTRWAFADHVFERDARQTTELDDNLVGTTDLDPAERSDPDQPRMEPGRSLSSSAYFPPRDLWPTRGAPRTPRHDAPDPRSQKAAA